MIINRNAVSNERMFPGTSCPMTGFRQVEEKDIISDDGRIHTEVYLRCIAQILLKIGTLCLV